jgi:putative ABC transport system ATP-binding protein
LGCLSQPTSGKYLLDGEDVSNLNKVQLAGIRNKKLGFVFQAYNLLPRTTALQNVSLPLFYNHSDTKLLEDGKARARAMLEMVGLPDRMHHKPDELSGGQQQRVAIARALINDPVLIIADEPTGNLDTHSGEEIMNLLHKLHAQGKTIVMVTHDPKIAEHTQRTINLLDGEVEAIVSNGKHSSEKRVQHETA